MSEETRHMESHGSAVNACLTVSSDEEIGRRIGVLIQDIGTLKEAAAVVGMTSGQLGKWRDAEARIALVPAAVLCAKAGRSLNWLVYGQDADKPEATWDFDEMQEVIEAVGREVELQDRRLRPDKFARLCVVIYQLIIKGRVEKENRASMVAPTLRLIDLDRPAEE